MAAKWLILTNTLILCLLFFTKVGKTMPCLPSPSHHFFFKGGTEIPFPVMGGKNCIALPTLLLWNKLPWVMFFGNPVD